MEDREQIETDLNRSETAENETSESLPQQCGSNREVNGESDMKENVNKVEEGRNDVRNNEGEKKVDLALGDSESCESNAGDVTSREGPNSEEADRAQKEEYFQQLNLDPTVPNG